MVQGPPGTGKTTVLIECIHQFLAVNPCSRVLVSAGTNTAVDVLFRRFRRDFESCLRIGHPSRVAHDLHDGLLYPATATRAVVNKLLATRVVFATLSSCMSDLFAPSAGQTFDVIVIDEAGQSCEYMHWGALNFGGQLWLAGDHLQLPPVVLSRSYQTELSVSLLERMVTAGHPFIMLKIQHRDVYRIKRLSRLAVTMLPMWN